MLDYRTIVDMVQRDPLVVFGFLVCGLAGLLYFRMLRRLLGAGAHIHSILAVAFTVPIAYLRNCSRFGWSPSLPYATWATLSVGIAMLVVGLFRLAP
jgi:hypothetical protein